MDFAFGNAHNKILSGDVYKEFLRGSSCASKLHCFKFNRIFLLSSCTTDGTVAGQMDTVMMQPIFKIV